MTSDGTNIPGPPGEPTPEGALHVLISSYRRGSDDVEAAIAELARDLRDAGFHLERRGLAMAGPNLETWVLVADLALMVSYDAAKAVLRQALARFRERGVEVTVESDEEEPPESRAIFVARLRKLRTLGRPIDE